MRMAASRNRRIRTGGIVLFALLPFLLSLSVSEAAHTVTAGLPSPADKPQESQTEKPAEKKNPLNGSVGAGLSMTSGNSNTLNWNVSFNANKKTGNGHDFKASGLYMRGEENNTLSVDRLKLNFRDDYSINSSVVGFGDFSYKRDPLKGIDHLINPSGGLGWKIVEKDRISLQANAGAGVVMEENNGLGRTTSVSLNSSQSFFYKISDTATFREKMDVLWKADNVDDYLVNFSMSLATKVTKSSELQAEFLDDFKSNPTNISYKKNDIALILKYVVRF